jgi:hypothetical protein
MKFEVPITTEQLLGPQVILQCNVEDDGRSKRQNGRRRHDISVLVGSVFACLRDIAYHQRKRMHALYLEGIDHVLAKYGQHSIKELTKKAHRHPRDIFERVAPGRKPLPPAAANDSASARLTTPIDLAT